MFKYLDRRNYEPYSHQILFQLSKGNEAFLHRMSLLQSLDIHHGCVNSVVWDDAGELLLSGSDDQQLIISKPWLGNTSMKLHTAHRANIFSAKFIPYTSNHQIISCSGDGMLIFTDLDRIPETFNCKFTCHVGTCYDVLTIGSDPHSFFSCGEDGTVRWFDLRVKTSCSMQDCKEDILLNMRRAATAIAVNPLVHYQLAVSTQDSTTHIYDRRMLGTKAHDSYLNESNQAVLMRLKPEFLEGKSHRVTSLRYSEKGDMVLANYSSDYLYLFDIQNSKKVPLEPIHGDHSFHDEDSSSGPTLKRLRLRGDWSDTGPQAVPESELRNQAEDVGQARPTLHSTLMQRMTDILSRMLPNPSTRATSRQRSFSSRNPSADLERSSGENDLFSRGEIASDGASNSSVPISYGDEEPVRETSSAPASITALSTGNVIISDNIDDDNHEMPPCSSVSDTPVINDPPSCLPLTNDYSLATTLHCITHSAVMSVDATPDSNSPELNMPVESSLPERIPNLPSSIIVDETSSICANIDTMNNNEQSIENDNRTISLASNSEDFLNENITGDTPTGDQLSCFVINSGAVIAANTSQSTNSCATQPDDLCNSSSNFSCNTAVVSDATSCNFVTTTHTSSNDNISINNGPNDSFTKKTYLSNLDGDNNSAFDECRIAEDNSSETCEASAACGESSVAEPCHSIQEQSTASPLLNVCGPSTSLQTSPPLSDSQNIPDRISPKRRVQTQDDVAEDDTSERRTTTNSRLARAIERVRQQMRDENKPSSREETIKRSEGDGYDKPISYGLELMQYKGHRNARTMIKEACFWGDSHVMSGSDCGRVFVWDKTTGRLVMLWEADRHVVNCLQPHPTLPILATSGIDYDIKLWAPTCDDPKFDEENAIEIAKRNEMLLAETRDTVTVPATFMIRMLASLNQLRRDRLRNRNRNQSDEEEEENDDTSDD